MARLPSTLADRTWADIGEQTLKKALTQGVEDGVQPFTKALMSPVDYEAKPPLDPNLIRDANRATMVAVAQTLRSAPLQLPGYTVAGLPAAADWLGAVVYCSNGAGGSPCLAFSNGSNWLRCDTLAAVSP